MPLHPGQQFVYDNLGRRNTIRMGRRWGKSSAFENWSCNWAMNGMQVGVFAPDYDKLLPSYRNILKILRPAVRSSSKNDYIIELKNDSNIEFFSLQDIEAGRSREFHRVLVDEASLAPNLEYTFEKAIKPTLLKSGGYAVLAGTPLGVDETNFFYKMCHGYGTPEEWNSFHAPTTSNPHLPPEELAKIQKDNHPLIYRQEYLAEFVDWRGQALFSQDYFTNNGLGILAPQKVDYVFAVVDSALKTGKAHDGTGVVYFARNRFYGPPLIILDYDYQQIQGNMLADWMPSVFKRLNELRIQCGAREPNPLVYVEDKGSGIMLLQHGETQGWPMTGIPAEITALGKDQRAMMAVNPCYQNQVKITAYAADKKVSFKGTVINHLMSQTCGFVIADPKAATRADDLADCVFYGIIIALEGAVH